MSDKNADGQAGQEAKPVDCWCHACNQDIKVDMDGFSVPFAATRMILCPECGNKRCPHASDHELACTGSNEPNQPGSVYTAPSQEGHAAGPACSAPDEALIEEIAEHFWLWNSDVRSPEVVKAIIREYIRRSALKATHKREEPDDFMEEGDNSWCHDSDMGAR